MRMKTAFRRVRCRVEKTAAISLVAFAFAPQSIIRTNVPLLHVLASVSSSTIRYCNRGYCYTRREPEHHHGLSQHDLVLDPSLRTDHHGSRKKPSLHDTRSGIDFCTDAHGHVMDCELYSILGMDRDELEAEFEALESTGPSARSGSGRRGVGKEDEESQNKEEKKMDDLGEGPESQEEGIIDVDDHDFDSPRVSGHVSWKDRPVRGKCYDNDSGYIFECDLVQILDDGRVLIEDHSHGGVIAAIAKSGYHTRRKKSNMEEEIRTPKVLNGAAGPLDTGDPAEDFRTNVFLNLEGI